MKLILNVSGMSCMHCEKRVENALKEIGINASANSKKGTVLVQAESEKTAEIKKVIEELGFTVNG